MGESVTESPFVAPKGMLSLTTPGVHTTYCFWPGGHPAFVPREPKSPQDALLARGEKKPPLTEERQPELRVIDVPGQPEAAGFKRHPINRKSLKIDPGTVTARVHWPSLGTSGL